MTNHIYFSDFYNVDPEIIDNYGALDISLLNDLPLFIDPFLIFCSEDPECQKLHDEIIKYLVYLRDRAINEEKPSSADLQYLYCFPEVRQTYLGFSLHGNYGSGLGMQFASALHSGLRTSFSDFGNETITKGQHIEKVCLLKEGVGRDNISDFITNLIKPYLCEYTQRFAKEYLQPEQCDNFCVAKCCFDYSFGIWKSKTYYLPKNINEHGIPDYILLTPKDLLVRDTAWINRQDMIRHFSRFAEAIPDEVLRDRVNEYFAIQLGKETSREEREKAVERTLQKFPELLDYYIRHQEDREEEALIRNITDVQGVQFIFIKQLLELVKKLIPLGFYQTKSPANSYEEAMERVQYLKQVIESEDGYRYFYDGENPIRRESDIHLLYKLACCNTIADTNAEVNNGRGPVDFKLSNGRKDQTLVEFKLVKTLKNNLLKQVEVYKQANDHPRSIVVIIFFTDKEHEKMLKLLNELRLTGMPWIVTIDARKDNKIQASKAM